MCAVMVNETQHVCAQTETSVSVCVCVRVCVRAYAFPSQVDNIESLLIYVLFFL